MAVTPGGVGVTGADRVPMARLAVDLASRMPVHGVITDQEHRVVARQSAEDLLAGTPGCLQSRPVCAGEDALVGGAMTWSEGAEEPQEVGDGASPGGQQGRQGQESETAEGGDGEGRGQRQQYGR